jgi:Tfp pilus assembly PilM family ATPase
MSDCQVLYIELPKSAQNMVDELLPIEARKYTTQSINELRLTYEPVVPVGKNSENKIAYVVLLIKENQYNFIHDAISNALHTEDIIIEPGIFGAVRMIPIENLLTSQSPSNPYMQLVVDIGAHNTTVASVIGGVLYGAQTIDDGMSEIVTRLRQSMGIDKIEAEKIIRSIHTLDQNDMSVDVVLYGLEHLIEKVIHILNSFKLRYTTSCDHVYITGGGSLLLMLSQMLTASLKLPVDTIDITQRVHTPMVLHDIVYNQSAILVNAAGLAISQLE